MDQILANLIENENEAEGRLDYCSTEFERELNLDLLEKARKLINAYINYKKLEAEYITAFDCRNNIYHAMSQVEKGVK